MSGGLGAHLAWRMLQAEFEQWLCDTRASERALDIDRRGKPVVRIKANSTKR